jgi:hypothetical protein
MHGMPFIWGLARSMAAFWRSWLASMLSQWGRGAACAEAWAPEPGLPWPLGLPWGGGRVCATGGGGVGRGLGGGGGLFWGGLGGAGAGFLLGGGGGGGAWGLLGRPLAGGSGTSCVGSSGGWGAVGAFPGLGVYGGVPPALWACHFLLFCCWGVWALGALGGGRLFLFLFFCWGGCYLAWGRLAFWGALSRGGAWGGGGWGAGGGAGVSMKKIGGSGERGEKGGEQRDTGAKRGGGRGIGGGAEQCWGPSGRAGGGSPAVLGPRPVFCVMLLGSPGGGGAWGALLGPSWWREGRCMRRAANEGGGLLSLEGGIAGSGPAPAYPCSLGTGVRSACALEWAVGRSWGPSGVSGAGPGVGSSWPGRAVGWARLACCDSGGPGGGPLSHGAWGWAGPAGTSGLCAFFAARWGGGGGAAPGGWGALWAWGGGGSCSWGGGGASGGALTV